jgi:hypothetical protein
MPNNIAPLSLGSNNAAYQQSMVNRFNLNASQLYSELNIYDDTTPSDLGIRQPYVWIPLSTNDVTIANTLNELNIVGATDEAESAIDVIRITKFLGSLSGITFLARQALLQSYNAFNETSLYDPTSVIQTVSSYASYGLLPPATRFVDQNLSNILNDVGIKLNISPPGTLSNALPSHNLDEGAGLQRFKTTLNPYRNFALQYGIPSYYPKVDSSDMPAGILGSIVSGDQQGVYKLGDNIAYQAMLNATNKSFNSVFGYFDSYGANVSATQKYYNSNLAVLKTSLNSETIKIYSSASTLSGPIGTLNVPISISSTNANYSSVIKSTTDLNDNGADASVLSNIFAVWSDQQQQQKNSTTTPSVSDINELIKAGLNEVSDTATAISAPTINYGVNVLYGIKTFDDLKKINNKISVKSSIIPPEVYTKEYKSKTKSSLSDKNFPVDDIHINNRLSKIDTYNSQIVSKIRPTTNDDLISFYFNDLINNNFIPFRATLTNLSNSNKAKWEEVRYIGRADRLFIYEGFDRDISFSFKVYANSVDELLPIWTRINYLTGLISPANYTAGPNQSGEYMVPPFINLTIGDMFTNQPIILQSVDITVPEEASWELSPSATTYSYFADIIQRNAVVGQVPICIEISISCALLEKERPNVGRQRFGDNNEFGMRLVTKIKEFPYYKPDPTDSTPSDTTSTTTPPSPAPISVTQPPPGGVGGTIILGNGTVVLGNIDPTPQQPDVINFYHHSN